MAGCPATWKEMSGNFDARRENQGTVREFCCVKFIFNQFEHPNFENLLGRMPPGPPKQS